MNVVIATVIEDQPRFRDRALNLALSVRSPAAGALADADLLVCSVDSLESRTRDALRELDVSVEIVPVFDERNRRSNKLRVLEVLADSGHDHVLSLDSDVIVAGDLSPHLDPRAVGLTPAALEALPEPDWQRLFSATGVEQPRRSLVATLTGDLMYPYYNSGVVLVPGALVAPLHQAWAAAERELLDLHETRPDVISRWDHLNQFGLMVALLRTGLDVHVLPYEVNVHSSARPQAGSPADRRLRPVLLHYHNKLDPRGFVRRTGARSTASAIECFNARRASHTGQAPPPTRLDAAFDPERLLRSPKRLLGRSST